MELALVLNALRRRWWIVLAFGVLGLLAGQVLGASDGIPMYRSQSIVLVSPPNTAQSAVFQNQLDRYVANELGLLQSDSLRQQVVDAVGAETGYNDVGLISEVTMIEQRPQTDIVDIIVTTNNPEASQAIAQAYADSYVNGRREIVAASQEPEIAAIDARLGELEDELDSVTDAIDEAYVGCINLSLDPNSTVACAQPNILVPELETQRINIQFEQQSLITAKNNLAIIGQAESTSEIIQNAPLPTIPQIETNELRNVGLIIGLMLGVVAAVTWHRISRYVSDEGELAEVISVPIVGELNRSGAVSRNPIVAFDALPRQLQATVDQLGVRAEAMAQPGQPLTIAVVGSQRSAGATTVAMAMAGRLARADNPLLLVDADGRDPQVTDLFDAWKSGGLQGLLEAARTGAIDQPGRASALLAPTSIPQARVVGIGNAKQTTINRDAVDDIIRVTGRLANVVIFDGGPVLDAASTVRLCRLADVVVLAVPLDGTKINELEDVMRQLGDFEDKVLPVVTNPSRRRRPVTRADDAEDDSGSGIDVAFPVAPLRPDPTPTPAPAAAPDPDLVAATQERPGVGAPIPTPQAPAAVAVAPQPEVDGSAEAEDAYREALKSMDSSTDDGSTSDAETRQMAPVSAAPQKQSENGPRKQTRSQKQGQQKQSGQSRKQSRQSQGPSRQGQNQSRPDQGQPKAQGSNQPKQQGQGQPQNQGQRPQGNSGQQGPQGQPGGSRGKGQKR